MKTQNILVLLILLLMTSCTKSPQELLELSEKNKALEKRIEKLENKLQ